MTAPLTKNVHTTGSEFNFENRYVTIDGHKIHYVEHGSGEPILFVHGNPTSSYAYRNVLRPIAEATQRRCIAIDLLGFGKSDKPQVNHTCRLHIGIIKSFIQQLDLKNIILVAEDWGGFFSGYVMTRHPDWFQSAILMETFLWSMTWEDDFDPEFEGAFKLLRSPIGGLFSKGMNIMINKLIPQHCPISEESLQYYRESVPTYKARRAVGAFPKMLPINGHPAESQDVADELVAGLKNINFPLLWIKADPGVVVSNVNPIGMGRLEELQKQIPSMEVRDFGKGNHFLPEDNPEKLAEMVSKWIKELPKHL